MEESALSLREQKTAQTARELRMTARSLTADRGLAGFTIEELCAEVGVARRTFFNYFASKENAVIGIPLRADDRDLDEAFAASSGPVLDALIDLLIARWARLQMTGDEVAGLISALEREPKLVGHVLGLGAEAEREDTALVVRREGTEPGDVRAATAVHVAGGIMRAVTQQFFDPTNTDPFDAIARERLAAARSLLAP